ncbi:hypothetical protein E1262_00165 [Jiangella aurantiaca]|uniref:Uncharacterized protein n=1 Tax=Jiangella aurantiaca TaxID=2530373 RepID=A0A4R5AK08_9ACTN|nr:hypothetical protein [Jiangella aurantiaca]TDD72951.1 hypothetical protein E1262_00165 [Jiangella aurantiaca]
MTAGPELTLDQLAGDAAVERLYRQVFAVLARESGAMISDLELLDVDEAILDAFADAGRDGLTVDQAVAACRPIDPGLIHRRFEVLRDYGAISKVVDRPNERFHRAAFAPYVMLLFLRRLAEQGGQAELHQLLTLEHVSVTAPDAEPETGQTTISRLTRIFRHLGNELAILAAGSTAEQLGDHAQLLWGNKGLISQAEEVHTVVLNRWPQLDRECTALRVALAAYGDAVEKAAGRLIERAGTTRALGLLSVETWLSFARTANEDDLAGVLDTFVFDAPAPWFSPNLLTEAVESGRGANTVRQPPPRPEGPAAPPPDDVRPADDAASLRETAERLLGDGDAVAVSDVLDDAGDWLAARRLLADLTAIHHHPDLAYELTWSDGLHVDPGGSPSWVSDGTFRRGRTEDAA